MGRRRSIAIALSLLAAGALVLLTFEPQWLTPMIAWRHPGVRWISRGALAARLASSEPPILLDARAEEEVAVSTIRGARRIDPRAPRVEEVPRDRDVVVYCSIGVRSAHVAERLAHAGHARVWNLEGGIFGWANEGRPLWRGDARASTVHPYDALWGLLLRADLRAEVSERGARASGGS